jgi:multiple sugar transport system permease protein
VNRRLARVGLYASLVAGAGLALLPLLWMISASFMPAGEANRYPPRLWPSHPTFEHYRTLFGSLDLGRNLFNTTFIALTVTTVGLFVNSMAGYALAKLRFRRKAVLFRALSAGLILPVQVSMLPLFLLLRQMGLVNSYWGVIIPSLASIFGIFLVRQYTLALPDDLLDAARVDGAGELRIYWSVVLPLIRPILVTIAVWTFVTTWNDFMWPLIVLSDSSKYTLPVALANLSGEHVQDVELMMAGAVVTVLPVLALFIILQRYYIAGLMAGSVKG